MHLVQHSTTPSLVGLIAHCARGSKFARNDVQQVTATVAAAAAISSSARHRRKDIRQPSDETLYWEGRWTGPRFSWIGS